ncbi:MAG: FKBP-type peptidyl-prolyl cis-trans isomerase [Paludibacteraceae bacterium]|nr:FKBP-type peptidyl-prolyl cis-trans isomerase [Paludibacteraceae bacterium]
MRDIWNIFISLAVLFSVVACHSNDAPQVPFNKLPKNTINDDLMALNAGFMELEREDIKHYIDSLGLQMDTTISGLHYRIDEEGYGDSVAKFDEVTIRYTMTLLDGTTCDDLRETVKMVRLGKGNLIKGLEEAVSMLKVSGSGTFIIPSYLAYGVSGKIGCVPPWNPLFCKVCLIEKRK